MEIGYGTENGVEYKNEVMGSTLLCDIMTSEYSHVKPYLRPIYFISEEEINEIYSKAKPYIIESIKHDADSETPNRLIELTNNFMVEGVIVEEFHKRHIDYHGLIEKGLALEAPEGMYKTTTES